MKVKELIQLLQAYDGDALVIISRDDVGTELLPLDKVEEGMYSEEDEEVYSNEDVGSSEGYVPCVTLWPY